MTTTNFFPPANPFLGEIEADWTGGTWAETLDDMRDWLEVLSALAYDKKHWFTDAARRERFSDPALARIDRQREDYDRMAEVLRTVASTDQLAEAIEAIAFVTTKFGNNEEN